VTTPSRTDVADAIWGRTPPTHRRYEGTGRVGTGADTWQRASEAVLRWGVKTRSGFTVPDAHAVTPGERLDVLVRIGPLTIREPVEVIEVVRTADRVGFAYRTRSGHPVDGEEAFILTRHDDVVSLTLRSLTRPSTTRAWALLFPVLRLAQVVVRRRYLRALR
jgi:uncharacterized protein (UPF0548 family)